MSQKGTNLCDIGKHGTHRQVCREQAHVARNPLAALGNEEVDQLGDDCRLQKGCNWVFLGVRGVRAQGQILTEHPGVLQQASKTGRVQSVTGTLFLTRSMILSLRSHTRTVTKPHELDPM